MEMDELYFYKSYRTRFRSFLIILLLLGFLSSSELVTAEKFDEMVKRFNILSQQYGDSYLYDKGSYAWGESYNMMAFAMMYEATRDITYLKTLDRHISIVFSKRDNLLKEKDYRGVLMPAWGTSKYTNGKHYVWAVHTGMITYPIARFVRLVYADEGLWKDFKTRADEYLRAVIDAVVAHDPDFREGPGENEGYYTFGDDYRSLGIGYSTLPLNQQNAIGRTFIELYRITGEEKYRERAARLAQFTKNRLFLFPNDSYVWMYWMDARIPYEGPLKVEDKDTLERMARSAEDVSHGAITADFIVQAYRSGIVFDEIDIVRLSNTLLHNIFTVDGMVRMRIGGAGELNTPGYAEQVGRWGGLAQFDRRVLQKLDEYYKKVNPPLVAWAIITRWQAYWDRGEE